MNQQQNAALESMKEWLAHPGRAGKRTCQNRTGG